MSREPLTLETSMPGVFAAGDVRQGSIKRVASAVGEGATVVRLVHEHLREDALLFRVTLIDFRRHATPHRGRHGNAVSAQVQA